MTLDPITLFFALVALILWISALISISNCPFGTGTDKGVWALIVLIVPLIGSLTWFGMGRKALIEAGDKPRHRQPTQ